MRSLFAVAAFVLGCSGSGFSPDEDLCTELGPVCDCNGEQVTGACEDGVLICDCPNGFGGEASDSGGASSGGASSGGAAETGGSVGSGGDLLPSSGGDVSTGGGATHDASGGSDGAGGEASGGATPETGGTSSGGSESGGSSSGGAASGGSGSGGSADSGGSGSGGSAPAMCSDAACLTPGAKDHYCGGDPEEPTCNGCSPGWCNCEQGPEYQSGGIQEACFYNSFPNYSCSLVCSVCLNSPGDCP